jgi:hypothetical protein
VVTSIYRLTFVCFQAHIGITVGGSGTFGVTLVDAQLVGYVNNTLRFHADAIATATTNTATLAYNYGVYLLYNLGYGGWANIPLYSWAVTSQNLFPQAKQITLYSNGDVLSTSSKRSLEPEERSFNSAERGLLNSIDGEELSEPTPILLESKVVTVDKGEIWSSSEFSNSSTPSLTILGLLRRTDPDTEMTDAGQSPDLSLAQSFTCPATACANADGSGDQSLAPCPSTLPDFRSKSPTPSFSGLFHYYSVS